jgi:hypothetical protein
MSNIIQDYNNKNNPETVDKLELPDTAASVAQPEDVNSLIPQPTSSAPEDNYVQATQSYVQFPDAPEYQPQNYYDTIPRPMGLEREQSVVDLGAFQGLPTGQEIDQVVKQGFQDELDWVRAQQANYTQAPVFDVTGNGYDYSLDTPQIDPFVPSNLNWKENAQAQLNQAQVAQQEQARLNEVGYNIEPQTNVVAQQGGFNAPVGTSSGGWSIGGLWQDIQGAFGFAQRAATTTLEGAIGRKVQNPLDVVEGLARTSLNPAGYVTTAAELALNEKKRNEAVKSAQRNFNPQTFNKNEVGVVKGLAPVKGPVNLSQGRFGDYGTGAPGAINYTLDNFLGGNTVRGLIANGKRNIENAANGRPQQWDEGLGVVAALKGRDYSFLNDKNKDTGVLGTNIHGGEFWARAGGGFIADAITDLSPLAVVKQAIKKGAKAGLKSAINSAVSPTTLKQLADNGDVIVEVNKKSVNGVKGTDLTTKKLAEILSPEKRAYYEKQGLVVVGAKQVEGPSAKKLAQQATRDAKKTAKTGKPVRRATPEVEYEFITRKKSELVQEGVSILTPKVAGQAPLNEVVSKPTVRSRFVEGRINDILPSPGATRGNPARIGEVGTPIPRPENPIQLKRREAGVQRAEQAAQQNPFLRNLIHKDKPPTELAGNGEVLGRVVTKSEKTALETTSKPQQPEVSPVTQYVKTVTGAPEETVLTDTVTRQLREPGAVENVLRQAELDGTIEVKPSGVIVAKVDSGIEAAQKELIRLRIEQTNLKRNTPNFDLVGQPGTKLGNQVQDIQQKIDELRQTISGGRVRREDYDVITNQDLDTLIPVIPSRTTDPLPLTPSTLYTRLKNESGVLQRGEFVERSMDDLSALAEFLGHRKPGLQKSITADQLEDLRTEYGMVYSRVGEPIDRGAIEQYLKTGVGRVETKPATTSSPQVETMVIRRNEPEPVAPELTQVEPPEAVSSGVLQKYQATPLDRAPETAQEVRSELLNQLDNPEVNQVELQKDLDQLALVQNSMEGPVEAKRTEQFIDNLPEVPATQQAREQAIIVREAEQLVADTAQRVRDLNLNIESLRQQLDVDNQRLLELPAVEPQPLDIGSYDRGLTSERIIGQSTVKPVPQKQVMGATQYTQSDIQAIVQDWYSTKDRMGGAPEQFMGAPATGSVDRFTQVWSSYFEQGFDAALRETDNFGGVEQSWLGMLRFSADGVTRGGGSSVLLSSPQYELAWSMVRTLQREAPEQFEELFAKLGKKMYPYKDTRAERELSSTEWLQRAEEYIKQNNVTNTINEEKFWHGSSFPDALEYGPEGVRPTRNPLGLGHYLYRDGSDAEAAARSVLPDNHVDVGLTPNENGVVQQVSVSVNTPLDATLPGTDDARYAFRQAIRDTFGDEGVALAKRWDTKTEGKPLSTYWDEATLVWSKLNKGEQIPEDVFRQLEVNISNNLIDLGYDSINHPRVLVLLDGSMAQGVDDVLELAPSNYSEKLLAQVNTTKLWQAVSPGNVADVHALNAQIEVGEALVDDSMQMLAKASADNQAAVEQMLRASDELSARLDADRVSRELKLQREGSDTVSRETDSLLKRDNDEHPGCL